MDRLSKDIPNFIWKGENALIDHRCMILDELEEISPNPRIEVTSLLGRNGDYHEWYGDYDSFDLRIPEITIPYKNIEKVKRWLIGKGKLITHNDPDKYLEARCNMNAPLSFKNEMGHFYKFELSFRCQPFRRKVREEPKPLYVGSNIIYDHGTEIAHPYFELDSAGGAVKITIKDRSIEMIDTAVGLCTIDTQLGICIQGGKRIRSKGDWPIIRPGYNTIVVKGNIRRATMLLRSVWI